MPDAGEPIEGAPTNYWAGQYDAEQFAEALGMDWTAGLFATTIPRIVNIPTLCAAPKPTPVAFTAGDILTGIFPGSPGRAAADAKVQAFTDAYLWETFCTPIGTPPPLVEPQPPPEDLPSNPLPLPQEGREIREIWQWTNWIKNELLPRSYFSGSSFAASEQGSATIAAEMVSGVSVFAAGIRVSVTAKPDYVGRSNGGDFPVFYDLGWLSMGTSSGADSPFRLAHSAMVVYGHLGQVTKLWWNLAPGVEVLIWPLYPLPFLPSE